MELTQQQVKDIITKAPAGTTPTGILAGLRNRGYTFQGYPAEQKPILPERKPSYWNNEESGILPYGKINEALAPTDSEKGITPGRVLANQAKSLVKAGINLAGFVDPLKNAKTIYKAGGERIDYEKEKGQAQESHKELQASNQLIENRIKQYKAEGKDTSKLEALLKDNKGIKRFNSSKELLKTLPGVAYQFAAAPAIQEAIQAGKEKGVGEGIYQGVKSISEDPFQLLPYGLMLKGAVKPGGVNAKGQPTKPGIIGDTRVGKAIDKTISGTGQLVTKPIGLAGEAIKKPFVRTPEKIIAARETELQNIENNYVKTRKAADYSKDANAGTRKRIASTDVLHNAVDENGLVRTKQPGGAIEQYKSQTIDGAESVVKTNLHRMGEKVNLKVVEKQLIKAVNESGLQGKNLTNALNNIRKEIAGYRLKADANGDVLVELMHDAKIDTTNSINYQTPPEIKTYNKAIARGLKTVVEDNSSVPVKGINVELGKYLEDISYLERLDGARVKGGKLGKYFSQIAGNVAGGVAGGMVGGIGGSALGTVLGGEVASRIKGQQLKNTLGGKTGNVAPKSEIINKAVETGKSPRNLPAKIPGRDYTPAGPSKSKSGQPLKEYAPIELGEGTTYEPQSRGRITKAQNQYIGKPINKPNTNVISESVPRMKDKVKGGLSTVDITKVHPEDVAIIRRFVDYVDSIKSGRYEQIPEQLSKDIMIIAEGLGILDKGTKYQATQFKYILEQIEKSPFKVTEVIGKNKDTTLPKLQKFYGKPVLPPRKPIYDKQDAKGRMLGSSPSKPPSPLAQGIDERLAPLADKDGMVTVYRASNKFPSDKLPKDTYVATNSDNARYYAESHYKGNPSDITVRPFKIPASQLKRGGSSDAWQLKEDFNLMSKSPTLAQEVGKLEPIAKEVQSMKIMPLDKAIKKFDETGSVTIAQRADGMRLTMKDEGDFVKVSIGTGGLVSTDMKLPSKIFRTKEEAFNFVKSLNNKPKLPEPRKQIMMSDFLKKLGKE